MSERESIRAQSEAMKAVEGRRNRGPESRYEAAMRRYLGVDLARTLRAPKKEPSEPEEPTPDE